MNKVFFFLLIISFLNNCSKNNNNESKIDLQRVSDIEKLILKDNAFDIYIYRIESSMSFGSGMNAMKILKHNEKPDFSNSDFFRIENSRPFKIKWKNSDLNIYTISKTDSFAVKQPLKTEFYTYKGVKIKNDIYTQFSGMAATDFKFNEFYQKNQNIIFKNNADSLVFDINKSQLKIGSNYLEVTSFVDNKFYKNKGLAFDSYKLLPLKNIDFSKFEKYQPLTIIEK